MSDLVLSHFGLHRHPFTPEIDADGLHRFTSFQQGLMRLEQALKARSSMLVVGSPGSGKTAMVRSLCRRLESSSFEVRDRLVAPTKNPARAVVDGLLADLGESVPFNNLARGIDNLRKTLRRLYESNRQPVLVLDDVHHLNPNAWLTLKSLLCFQLDSVVPVILILVGAQEETLRTLSLSSLQEVRDRLGLCYHLRSLKPEETVEYLHKRLSWAGCSRPLFPQEIAEQMGRQTQGLPRRINRLAAACLLSAASLQRELIDQSCLQQALSETQFQAPREETR